MTRKILSALLILALLGGLVSAAAAGPAPAGEIPEGAIVILHTNDVHCAVDGEIGCAGLAAYKARLEGICGEHNVTLVDAGDAIQGGNIGTVSRGSYLVDIMNQVGYDLAVPGNHEFDYGMEQFLTLAGEQAQFPYLSCNFLRLDSGEPALGGYALFQYGDALVAYVGISTPETFTKSTPAYFQDGAGNYLYTFCEGEEGQALYDQVQRTVDDARASGADYVVAVGHLGMNGVSEVWSSPAVIANTTGIDLFIDGHSHEAYQTTVANRDGEEVPLTQTGSKLSAIGQVVIDPAADTITCSLVTADEIGQPDGAIQSYIDGIQAQYQAQLEQTVAESEVTLNALDESGSWLVRVQETNLGDLCADAFRVVLGADVGLMNGGGIRADIEAGDVTMGDILDVYTFGNEACLVEITGQQLLDALEFSVRDYPQASGAFLQVSGLSCTIDPNLLSHVVTNDQGEFVEVDGAYRVRDVLVDGQPLDLAATYTVGGHNYMLRDGGDGFTMFGTDPRTVILQDGGMLDNDLLSRYITQELGGVITQAQYGQSAGRITVLAENPYPWDVDQSAWYFEAVAYALDKGTMQGTGANLFSPTGTVTTATVYQTLYNREGQPTPGADTSALTLPEGAWYAGAMTWAHAAGLYEGDAFPEDPVITRAGIAAILADYAAWKGLEAPAGDGSMAQASDYGEIPPESLEGMSFCYNAGLMTGDHTGRLNPGGQLTRAEFAQILYNLDALAAPAAA